MNQPKLPPAWILAGGLGTRLAGVLNDRPKALAPVAGRPFIDIVFEQLLRIGFTECVLLLGVRHQAIIDFLDERRLRRQGLPELAVGTSVEPRPLGTGGALKHASRFASEPFFVLNGDTYVDFDATEMVRIHRETKAILTMAAVEQADTARFGALDVTSDGCVCGFREKAASAGAGLINAGVYLMQPELLNYIAEGSVVSLEQTVFPNLLSAGEKIAVAKQRGDFFDIGTPDSLQAFVEYCRVVDSKSPESVPQ